MYNREIKQQDEEEKYSSKKKNIDAHMDKNQIDVNIKSNTLLLYTVRSLSAAMTIRR